MNSIGVILCAYDCLENFPKVIAPWLEVKKDLSIKIAAVHGQFKENHELGFPDKDSTLATLKLSNHAGAIDYLYIQNDYFLTKKEDYIYQTEAEIRDKGLQWLLGQNIDYVMLLDGDEFYTKEQIKSIFDYINRVDSQFYGWFSVPMKNYIFDGKCWIDGFCPPRIFHVKIQNGKLSKIYWDNDFLYETSSYDDIDYKQLANKSIPKNIINGGIRHMTWLHSNGKAKYEYQMKHFKHCGYKWNYETDKLEFNKEFYFKNNIPIPEINYELQP